MGDYTDEHGVGRVYSPEQVGHVAHERTCEKCGRCDGIKPHGWIRVYPRYASDPEDVRRQRYAGRFCNECWTRLEADDGE